MQAHATPRTRSPEVGRPRVLGHGCREEAHRCGGGIQQQNGTDEGEPAVAAAAAAAHTTD
eukprot:COSAG01_NODE_22622_length_848_cov_0.921228_2_plen_59_part_01